MLIGFFLVNFLGEVSIAQNIDYERIHTIISTVCATDNANDTQQRVPTNEARIGCATITIFVINENDNIPFFNPTNDIVRISEKSPIGLTVFQMSEISFDQDRNDVIFYEMNTTLTTANDLSKFNVDSAGIITVASSVLDYEAGQDTFVLYANPYNPQSPGIYENL